MLCHSARGKMKERKFEEAPTFTGRELKTDNSI